MHGFLVWLRTAVGAIKRGAYKTKTWIGRPITRLPHLKRPTDRRSDAATAAPVQQERRGGRGSPHPRETLPTVFPRKDRSPLSEDVQSTVEIAAQVLNSEQRQTTEKTDGNEKKTPRAQ